MRQYSFHSSVEQIAKAASLAKTRFFITAQPDLSSIGQILPKKLSPLLVIFGHLLLVLSFFRDYRKYDLILVREFLSVPLIPFVWLAVPLRKKICFINNHNLQKATVLKSHRFAFKALCTMGFKIAFLEGCDGLDALGIPFREQQFFSLPQPIIAVKNCLNEVRSRKSVGVVGAYRPEKGWDKLLQVIFEIKEKSGANIIVGTPNYKELKTKLGLKAKEIDIRDTTASDAYAEALMGCDVLLFSYNRDDYYYRPSGVIVNAVECGASVVCPDYPIFRRQVLFPKPIGCLYSGDSEIVETTLRALEDREKLYQNIEPYSAARTLQIVANCIDCFAEKAGLI